MPAHFRLVFAKIMLANPHTYLVKTGSKLIRPRTPWHNGKVERSHRNDQERFYNYLKFYSYEDLLAQMKRYLRCANNIPMAVLGWKSPQKLHSEPGG